MSSRHLQHQQRHRRKTEATTTTGRTMAARQHLIDDETDCRLRSHHMPRRSSSSSTVCHIATAFCYVLLLFSISSVYVYIYIYTHTYRYIDIDRWYIYSIQSYCSMLLRVPSAVPDAPLRTSGEPRHLLWLGLGGFAGYSSFSYEAYRRT